MSDRSIEVFVQTAVDRLPADGSWISQRRVLAGLTYPKLRLYWMGRMGMIDSKRGFFGRVKLRRRAVES